MFELVSIDVDRQFEQIVATEAELTRVQHLGGAIVAADTVEPFGMFEPAIGDIADYAALGDRANTTGLGSGPQEEEKSNVRTDRTHFDRELRDSYNTQDLGIY
jgi:hypothetical protein